MKKDYLVVFIILILLPWYISYLLIAIVILYSIVKKIMYRPSIKKLTDNKYEISQIDNEYVLLDKIECKNITNNIEKYTVINNKIYFIENFNNSKLYSTFDYNKKIYIKHNKITKFGNDDILVFNNLNLFVLPNKLLRKSKKH